LNFITKLGVFTDKAIICFTDKKPAYVDFFLFLDN
jgi:hypothetical protein